MSNNSVTYGIYTSWFTPTASASCDNKCSKVLGKEKDCSVVNRIWAVGG